MRFLSFNFKNVDVRKRQDSKVTKLLNNAAFLFAVQKIRDFLYVSQFLKLLTIFEK